LDICDGGFDLSWRLIYFQGVYRFRPFENHGVIKSFNVPWIRQVVALITKMWITTIIVANEKLGLDGRKLQNLDNAVLFYLTIPPPTVAASFLRADISLLVDDFIKIRNQYLRTGTLHLESLRGLSAFSPTPIRFTTFELLSKLLFMGNPENALMSRVWE
jgi:hypothetical protein